MRVCVVAELYPRRRDPVLGIWAHRQALAARDAGADVRVLALRRPIPPKAAFRRPGALIGEIAGAAREPRADVLDGIPVEYVTFVSPPRERSYAAWHRAAAPRLARALERVRSAHGIDLVHAHYALPAGAAVRGYAAEHGLPLVVSVHGGDILGKLVQAPPARAVAGEVLRGAAGVLCNSRATLTRAAALAGAADHMRVVHLGADPPEPPPRRRSEPTVATLAHVIPRKRHADVLRAVATLPGVRWVAIGDGPELPALRRLAGELGADGRVEWAGALPPDRAIAELARCHVMAMPSEDEAFGVAYAEALACGLPAIGCAGEGGPEEIAALGGGMLLVPPRDPAALAEAIARALGDLDSLSESARATAREHLSWRACGEATVAAYRDALGSR